MSKVTGLVGGQRGVAGQQGLHLRQVADAGAPPQESVGDDLRAARLRQGDELTRISRTLRIRREYLEAIESDAPDRLPGRAYAIGFVRSYAQYLGLDSPALVSRYKQQTAGQGEIEPQVGPPPEPENSRFAVAQAAVAVSVLALGIFGFYYFSQRAGSDRPVASLPATRQAVADRTARHSPQPAAANALAGLAAPPSLPGKQPIGIPKGQVFGAQNLNARVVLHAHGLTHVLVQGFSGRVYINRLLHPGDVYRVPNMVGLSLTTPNGGAVSLELDGRDMGAAGPSGRITEALSLDPGTIAARKGPGSPYESDKVTP
jgi:cytoskeleton protein RodZ